MHPCLIKQCYSVAKGSACQYDADPATVCDATVGLVDHELMYGKNIGGERDRRDSLFLIRPCPADRLIIE